MCKCVCVCVCVYDVDGGLVLVPCEKLGGLFRSL